MTNVDYVGRSAAVASAALSTEGLVPQVTTLTGGSPDDPGGCRVLYVSPTGDVRRGQ